MKIVFTQAEFARIQRGIARLVEISKKQTKKEQERGAALLIKQMCIKFSTMVAEMPEYEVYLKRTHLRVLEDYLEASHKALNAALVEYQNKGDKKEYEQTTREALRVVESAMNKVKGAM